MIPKFHFFCATFNKSLEPEFVSLGLNEFKVIFCLYLFFSKLSREAVNEAVATVLARSQEKKRKFTETVELQVALKNYDPQRDKRFAGTVKYGAFDFLNFNT